MKLTQAQFMRKYNETHREQFNPDLFRRDNEDIIQSMYNVLKSCEHEGYFTLKLMDFEVIKDYEAIYNKLRDHEERRRRKNDKTENLYDFINIKDTDMMLIKVLWYIRHNGTERQDVEGGSIEVENPDEVMEVLIAVPRFVRGYYFRLNGNYYTTTFQIVDGSTYNNSTANQSKVDTVSLKTTFAPVRIFRGFKEMLDICSNEVLKVIEYNSNIFYVSSNAMYYLLANFGLYGCMEYLGIHCVGITSEPVISKDYVCFGEGSIFVSCPKGCFQDAMVQSLCATLISGIMKDTKLTDLFDQRYWLRVLGRAFKNASIDKGLFVLDSVDGIYDLTTQEDLHLPDDMKRDIYDAMRWLLQEFSNLRIKENTDITTKRIRISDYIAQLYAKKLNNTLYNLSDQGRKVTLSKVKQRLYTSPLYLLSQISGAGLSNLVEYRDMVNDNDAMTALKFTYKGISGLGEDGTSVQPIYKYVDPSHIGIVDLDTSSNSDPGMSGMICPMAKLYDGSFSVFEEPHSWAEAYAPLESKYYIREGEPPISFKDGKVPEFDYRSRRAKIVAEEIEYNRVICPISSTDGRSFDSCDIKTAEMLQDQEIKRNLFTIIDDNDERYEDDEEE